MLWWLAFFLVTEFLAAEDPRAQAERVRSQMQGAIASQRESVKKQAAIAHPVRPQVAQESVPVSELLTSARPSIMARTRSACDPLPQPEVSSLVDFAAHENNLNPLLVQEVARQESGFRPCAVSSQGAMGLMQLMPDTQMQLGVANPWDPRESIEAGSRLLRQLLDRYHGDVSLALGAYNAGPSRVDQAGGIPPIPETRNYVDRILYRLLPNWAGSAMADLSPEEPSLGGP